MSEGGWIGQQWLGSLDKLKIFSNLCNERREYTNTLNLTIDINVMDIIMESFQDLKLKKTIHISVASYCFRPTFKIFVDSSIIDPFKFISLKS